jgi:hypothetical protein
MEDSPFTTYDVFVSLDEGDEKMVDFVRYWMLDFLENRRQKPWKVYLPLRQELPGVSRGEVSIVTYKYTYGKMYFFIYLLERDYQYTREVSIESILIVQLSNIISSDFTINID